MPPLRGRNPNLPLLLPFLLAQPKVPKSKNKTPKKKTKGTPPLPFAPPPSFAPSARQGRQASRDKGSPSFALLSLCPHSPSSLSSPPLRNQPLPAYYFTIFISRVGVPLLGRGAHSKKKQGIVTERPVLDLDPLACCLPHKPTPPSSSSSSVVICICPKPLALKQTTTINDVLLSDNQNNHPTPFHSLIIIIAAATKTQQQQQQHKICCCCCCWQTDLPTGHC